MVLASLEPFNIPVCKTQIGLTNDAWGAVRLFRRKGLNVTLFLRPWMLLLPKNLSRYIRHSYCSLSANEERTVRARQPSVCVVHYAPDYELYGITEGWAHCVVEYKEKSNTGDQDL